MGWQTSLMLVELTIHLKGLEMMWSLVIGLGMR